MLQRILALLVFALFIQPVSASVIGKDTYFEYTYYRADFNIDYCAKLGSGSCIPGYADPVIRPDNGGFFRAGTLGFQIFEFGRNASVGIDMIANKTIEISPTSLATGELFFATTDIIYDLPNLELSFNSLGNVVAWKGSTYDLGNGERFYMDSATSDRLNGSVIVQLASSRPGFWKLDRVDARCGIYGSRNPNDDIRDVDCSAVAPIPIPASSGLLFAALGTLGFARFRSSIGAHPQTS